MPLVLYIILSSAIVIINSCASTSRFFNSYRYTPPPNDFPQITTTLNASNYEAEMRQINRSLGTEASTWLSNYKIAQAWQNENSEKSCQLFYSLSQHPYFPLKDLAYLRAQQTCSLNENPPELPNIKLESFTNTPWLTDLALEVLINKLRSKNDTDSLMTHLKLKLSRTKSNAERIRILQESIALANLQNKPDEVTSLREELYRIAPRLNPTPTNEQLYSVEMDCQNHREYERARDIQLKLLSNKKISEDLHFLVLKDLKSNYKISDQKLNYLATAEKIVRLAEKYLKGNMNSSKHLKRYHDASVSYIRAIWTEDDVNKALKLIDETTKKIKGRYPLDELYWLKGAIADEKREFQEAISWYEKAEKEISDSSPRNERLLWAHAWALHRLERHQESAAILTTLVNASSDLGLAAKYKYWLARSLKQDGKNEEAKEVLNQLKDNDFYGYYGLMAYRELGEEIPSFESNKTLQSYEASITEEYLSPFDKNYFAWLIAVGEFNICRDYLNSLSEKLISENNYQPNQWLGLFSLYIRSQNQLALIKVLNQLPLEKKRDLYQHNISILFPQLYEHIVNANAQDYSVPKELIYAIIKQESGFDPRAKSPADALGLMQLLPSVARNVAERNSLSFNGAQDLYDPNINIKLGTSLIRHTLEKYNNQFILTVASYNANDRAIQGWLQKRNTEDPLEFIEEIPYEETRSYIKLVIRNFVFYQRLNTRQTSIPFPEWCLSNLQSFSL